MWQEFAETVNNWLIINANEIGINHPEDKRLGPWFVDERNVQRPTSVRQQIVHLSLDKCIFLWNCKREGFLIGNQHPR